MAMLMDSHRAMARLRSASPRTFTRLGKARKEMTPMMATAASISTREKPRCREVERFAFMGMI
jgi:hypothetical protein